MSILKRLWANIARFGKALEGMDDPMGEYMSSIGSRLDKLEQELEQLKRPNQ